MDLRLRARASLKKKGLFSSSRIKVEDVVATLIAGAKGTPLEATTSSRKLGPGRPIAITMHPNAGRIFFIHADDDDLEIEAKAYTVGPGYHAFLVSILDSMQSSLGLRWEWADETGYSHKRDFADLQSRMAKSFREICAGLVKQIHAGGEATGAKIFMPANFCVVAAKDEIFTPFGPITLKQLEDWASIDGAELRKAAAGFYMWWDQGFGGSFYRGVTLYRLWMDIRWATPLDHDEAELVMGTLRCYAAALEHRAELPVPQPAITELFALIDGNVMRPVANSHGIGYRRRAWARPVGSNWRLVMPGSLEPTEEGDNAPQYVFATDGLDIRASVYVAPSDDEEIRAGVFDGEITNDDHEIERLGKTVRVRTLAKTHARGEETDVCFLSVTSSTPELHSLGEQIAKTLTYLPDGQV